MGESSCNFALLIVSKVVFLFVATIVWNYCSLIDICLLCLWAQALRLRQLAGCSLCLQLLFVSIECNSA
jgi:hypothetical protein